MCESSDFVCFSDRCCLMTCLTGIVWFIWHLALGNYSPYRPPPTKKHIRGRFVLRIRESNNDDTTTNTNNIHTNTNNVNDNNNNNINNNITINTCMCELQTTNSSRPNPGASSPRTCCRLCISLHTMHTMHTYIHAYIHIVLWLWLWLWLSSSLLC